MFRITKDPSSGSDNLHFDWNYLKWFTNIYHVRGRSPTTHMINICEPLQVISVNVQVSTPWWWILCGPKHVGVIFNYVSFKLLYDKHFNIYVLYNWVHYSANKSNYFAPVFFPSYNAVYVQYHTHLYCNIQVTNINNLSFTVQSCFAFEIFLVQIRKPVILSSSCSFPVPRGAEVNNSL
jgi:hypothetical protein